MRITKKLIESCWEKYLDDVKQGWDLSLGNMLDHIRAGIEQHAGDYLLIYKDDTIQKKLLAANFTAIPETKWSYQDRVNSQDVETYWVLNRDDVTIVGDDDIWYEFRYKDNTIQIFASNQMSNHTVNFIKYFAENTLYFEKLYQRARIEYRKFLAEEKQRRIA